MRAQLRLNGRRKGHDPLRKGTRTAARSLSLPACLPVCLPAYGIPPTTGRRAVNTHAQPHLLSNLSQGSPHTRPSRCSVYPRKAWLSERFLTEPVILFSNESKTRFVSEDASIRRRNLSEGERSSLSSREIVSEEKAFQTLEDFESASNPFSRSDRARFDNNQ